MFEFKNVSSLGHKKGLLLLKNISEITAREHYLVVKTPSNKKYISANFVLFKDSPNLQSIDLWPKIFENEFSNDAEIKHIKLEWNTNERNNKILYKFEDAGFSLEEYETLSLNQLRSVKKVNSDIKFKEINYKNDWNKIIVQQMLFKSPLLTEKYYKEFSETLMYSYHQLIQKGLCKWFGAYSEDQLIGSLGILWSNEIVGFQRVVIDQEFQNQGICTNFIHWVSQWIQVNLPNRQIVIWAEKDSISSKIYRSCGYSFAEELLALNKYPQF